MIGVATRCLRYDEEFYENPNVFQPFRFAEMHEGNSEDVKHQFVSTAIEYLPFGHGKHAWYGVFILVHVVVIYDVKLEDGATHPRSLRFGTSTSPDPRAKVLFRRRVD